jgi:hypothetical protein
VSGVIGHPEFTYAATASTARSEFEWLGSTGSWRLTCSKVTCSLVSLCMGLEGGGGVALGARPMWFEIASSCSRMFEI